MSTITTTKIQTLLQEFRWELEKLYGNRLVQIILYGSQARGEANADSDIDLMVVLKSPVSPGTEIFRMGEAKTELNLKYDELISVFPISEEDFLWRQFPLLKNVRREGITV